MFELAPGRRALVTGGASGLGLGIATALHAAGVRLAIADVDGSAAERAAVGLPGTLPIAMDVRDAASVAAGVEAAAQALGGLDTLVTSAGVFAMGPFDTLPLADRERVLAVNLTGAFLCARNAAAHLAERRSVSGDIAAAMPPACTPCSASATLAPCSMPILR